MNLFILYFRCFVYQPQCQDFVDSDQICVTYPKQKNISQMFFSADIISTDLAETLRSNDPVKICAKKLRDECRNVNFNLERSFNSAEDINTSYSEYTNNRPVVWEHFFNEVFSYRAKSDHIRRKTDAIFQSFHNILHNVHRKTPFHDSISQAIHDTTRSKTLIKTLNKLEFCISYDELGRIDMGLAQRTIDAASNHITPVPPTIEDSVMIHEAMGNFDHDERTHSCIGGRHDTILMLFQNTDKPSTEKHHEISVLPSTVSLKARSLQYILECQKLVKRGKFTVRGKIPESFTPQTTKIPGRTKLKAWENYLRPTFQLLNWNVTNSTENLLWKTLISLFKTYLSPSKIIKKELRMDFPFQRGAAWPCLQNFIIFHPRREP